VILFVSHVVIAGFYAGVVVSIDFGGLPELRIGFEYRENQCHILVSRFKLLIWQRRKRLLVRVFHFKVMLRWRRVQLACYLRCEFSQ